jgi:hypothetical protein
MVLHCCLPLAWTKHISLETFKSVTLFWVTLYVTNAAINKQALTDICKKLPFFLIKFKYATKVVFSCMLFYPDSYRKC